jgi:hypothetical protein
MKSLTEIPNFNYAYADDIGLRRVSNGVVAWIEDKDGNQYRSPPWLLDLLHIEREEGRAEIKFNVSRALRELIGLKPD